MGASPQASPALGARFYGLGNEYLGIFLEHRWLVRRVIHLCYGRRWGGLWLGACSLVLFAHGAEPIL